MVVCNAGLLCNSGYVLSVKYAMNSAGDNLDSVVRYDPLMTKASSNLYNSSSGFSSLLKFSG